MGKCPNSLEICGVTSKRPNDLPRFLAPEASRLSCHLWARAHGQICSRTTGRTRSHDKVASAHRTLLQLRDALLAGPLPCRLVDRALNAADDPTARGSTSRVVREVLAALGVA
jgi:hypothetical protein